MASASSTSSANCSTAYVACRSVLTRAGRPVPQKVVVFASRSAGTADSEPSTALPERRVVDGQVVAAEEDNGIGGVAAQLLGGDRGGLRALAARVLEPAAGHRPEDAGAPHPGEHHERDGELPPPSAGGGTSLGRGPRTWRLQC